MTLGAQPTRLARVTASEGVTNGILIIDEPKGRRVVRWSLGSGNPVPVASIRSQPLNLRREPSTKLRSSGQS